jgi:hypothetical protein
VRQAAGKSVPIGQFHGKSISIPVAPLSIGGIVLLQGGLEVMTQPHAEKELEGRLGQLTRAGDRISRALRQAAPNLGMLQSLAEELARPGT